MVINNMTLVNATNQSLFRKRATENKQRRVRFISKNYTIDLWEILTISLNFNFVCQQKNNRNILNIVLPCLPEIYRNDPVPIHYKNLLLFFI